MIRMNPTTEDIADIDRLVEEEGEGGAKKKVNMTDKLIKIAMSGSKLFHDVDGSGYIAIPQKEKGDMILPITGSDMRAMLAQRYFKKHRRAPSEKSVKEAIGVLNGIAMFDMEEIRLHNRVAWRGGDIVYDMSDKMGQEVIISPAGWGIKESVFPTFKRYPHQSAQKTPVAGGDINDIFNIINVVEGDRLLTLVHLISSLIPDIPHPMIVLGGEQGSAKSSASKMFKALIDPSMIDTVAMPRNGDRMHQVLSKHWYLMFDNVSWIQDWQSDVFCRAVTGQADVVREYYTTSDDHIVSYKMCLGMNGITSLVTSADLLDRTLMIRLNPITDGKRRSEEEINNEFDNLRGTVLGAMFDVVGKAVEIYPSVSMDGMPRMADFAKWGCAISEALGYTQKDFMVAYGEKIDAANEDAIEATPVAGLIIRLMEDRDVWVGTPKELWMVLLEFVAEDGMNKGDVHGMKSVKALGRARDRIVPNLRRFGIDWMTTPRESAKRGYRIEKHITNGRTTQQSMTIEDVNDECTPLVVPSKNNGGKGEDITIGAHSSQTNKTSQQSKRIDFDQKTIDRIRKATSEAIEKSNSLDGCDVDQITFATHGLARSTVAKCVLLNPGGAWETGARKDLYRLRV